MDNFPLQNTDHVAGLRSFEYIEAKNVLALPEGDLVEISEADISLKAGASWKMGEQAFKSLTHAEPEVESDAGNYFENSVGGFYVGDSTAFRRLLRDMQHKKFILKVRDNEGKLKLVGTVDEPLRFKADYQAGTVGGLKGYRFTFYNAQVERCFILTQFGLIFSIDEQGHLVLLSNDHPDNFSINANGELEVSGPHENGYSIGPSGNAEFTA